MRILSIDGGGIRGIVPALVLAELEARAGQPVASLFDLVAGTSTGAILACALCRPDPEPASALVGLYVTEGPRIFRRSLGWRVRSVEGLVEEKHESAALRSALDARLRDVRLHEATVRLLVPTYDIEARAPLFFKSWREELADARLADIALAATAAPTYFEPVRVAGHWLVDGGVFANDPAMCAYAEAVRLGDGRAEDLQLVSLGTGQHTRALPGEQVRGWGVAQWVRPLLDVVLDGAQDAVDYQLRRLLRPGAYDRFQVELDAASDDLDDASARNLELLQEQAAALIAARGDDLDRLAAALAAR